MFTDGKWDMWENGDGEVGVEIDGNSICTMEGENKKGNAFAMAKAPEFIDACVKLWQSIKMTGIDEIEGFQEMERVLSQIVSIDELWESIS